MIEYQPQYKQYADYQIIDKKPDNKIIKLLIVFVIITIFLILGVMAYNSFSTYLYESIPEKEKIKFNTEFKFKGEDVKLYIELEGLSGDDLYILYEDFKNATN